MHIVHSAYRETTPKKIQKIKRRPHGGNKEKALRYAGYQAACHKYQTEIEAIRQYLPDWKPLFI